MIEKRKIKENIRKIRVIYGVNARALILIIILLIKYRTKQRHRLYIFEKFPFLRKDT